jgi:hypothetical protein
MMIVVCWKMLLLFLSTFLCHFCQAMPFHGRRKKLSKGSPTQRRTTYTRAYASTSDFLGSILTLGRLDCVPSLRVPDQGTSSPPANSHDVQSVHRYAEGMMRIRASNYRP